jgi:hypothetical protein
MDHRLKIAIVFIIIILFKGSDKLLYFITVSVKETYDQISKLKKSKRTITNTAQAKDGYEKEIDVATKLMAQLLPEHWNFELEKSGVKVFLKPGPHTFNTFRGSGTFDRSYSLQEVISVIKSPYARKEWDGRYAEGKIIERNGNSFITHSVQKGTFPFAAREFSTIGRIEIKDNHACLVSTSIVHPKIEYDQAKVLANLYLGGWDIVKNGENLEITYIVQVDVGGSIPACIFFFLNEIALLKAIQTQSPLCVAAVIKYLDDNGPLPFVIQLNTNEEGIKIVKEEFNKSYNLAIKNQSSNSSSVLVALPSKRFLGAKIEISGHDSCKLEKNDSKYSQLISSAIDYILVVAISPSKDVTIDISPESQGFIINGSIVSQGTQRPSRINVFPGDSPQAISLLSPTLKSAEKILEKVDESWDRAVDTVAGSINQSHALARQGASKLLSFAKIIFFH